LRKREKNTEIAIIREIQPGTKTVVLNRLVNPHPLNTHVRGGFIPHYSPALGSGRIDAYYAVQAAWKYTHDERDLIIRNYLADDGVTETNINLNEINSPDIWVINGAAPPDPIAGPHGSPNTPPDYLTSGDKTLHKKPLRSVENSIYVRVGNRGSNPSFDYSVHIRMALKDEDITGKIVLNDFINGPTTAFPYLYIPLPSTVDPDSLFTGQNYNLNSGHPGALVLKEIHSLAAYVTPVAPLPVGRILRTLLTIQSKNGQHFVANLSPAQRPKLPYPFVATRITKEVKAPDNIITLEHTRGLTKGQQILIGRPADPHYRAATIIADPTINTITINGNAGNDYLAGTLIIRLENVTTNLAALAPAAVAGKKFSELDVNSVEGFKIGNHIISGPIGDPTNKFHRIVRIIRDTAVVPQINKMIIEPPLGAGGLASGISLTQVGGRLKTFILAEVTPHDGILAGNKPEDNNNISYKEITFGHEVLFKDNTGKLLSKLIQVENSGFHRTTNFQINIKDGDSFKTEDTVMTITRKLKSGNYEAATFSHQSVAPAGWIYDPAKPAWLTLNAPLITIGGPAAGAQTDIYFEGSFKADKTIDEISITVNLAGNDPVGADFITSETFIGRTTPALPDLADTNLQTQTGMPALAGTQMLHAFADMTFLEQTDASCFGPKDENHFRLTSSFDTKANPAVTVNAYAVVNGIVFIQRNIGNKTINLIIKPLKQSDIGFSRVKYFIYRGLKEEDFFTPVALPALPVNLIENSPLNPKAKFVDSVIAKQNKQHPGEHVLLTALGWDVNQAAQDSLDDFFFNSNPKFQLPIVVRGMILGTFKKDEFGFEIVMAEGAYSISLGNLRENSYTLDVSTIADPDEKAAKREDILNYIDPAAYYGMHYLPGIRYPALPDPIKDATLYDTVVSKFFTKNTLYVDIRNENGYSYNYYGNYTQPAGPDLGKAIKIGFVPPAKQALSTLEYSTRKWPVIIYNNSTSPENTPEKMSATFLQLSIGDNGNPIVFFEYGNAITQTTENNYVEGNNLLQTFKITDINPATHLVTVAGDLSALAVGGNFYIIGCDDAATNSVYKITAKKVNAAQTLLTVEPGTLVYTMDAGSSKGEIHFSNWTREIAFSHPNYPSADPNQKLNVAQVLKLRYFRQPHETGKKIIDINLANKQFTLAGLVPRLLSPGDRIMLTNGTANNNGTYTIALNGVMQTGNDTQITVLEEIRDGAGANNGIIKIKPSRVPVVKHYTDQKFGSINAVTRRFKITDLEVNSASQSIVTIAGNYKDIIKLNMNLSIVNASIASNNGNYIRNGEPILDGGNTKIVITTTASLSRGIVADPTKDLISVLALPWRTDHRTQWISGFDFRYLDVHRQITNAADIPKNGFAYMGQTGVAMEENAIIFLMTPLNFFKAPPLKSISPNVINMNGGTSTEESFWKVMTSQNQSLILNRTLLSLDHAPFIIPVFDFMDNAADGIPDDPIKSNFLGLCLMQNEFQRLKAAADLYLNRLHDVYIVLRKEKKETDANLVNFRTFELAVSGFTRSAVNNALVADEIFPATPVIVYSLREDSVVFTSKDFADIENTENEDVSYEEKQRLDKTALDVFALNAGIRAGIDSFKTNLNALTNDLPAITTLVQARAESLWTAAVTAADTGGPNSYDDRQLYWARLHAKNAIRVHPTLKMQFDRKNKMMQLFEESTRGFHTASFAGCPAGTVKILVIGFDPFKLDIANGDNPRQSNPSGSLALHLHGKTITKGAKQGFVQGMIFPVRFNEFDSGKVERILRPYFTGPGAADMIITCSMGDVNYFNNERFASRYRNPDIKDNENRKGGKAKFYKFPADGNMIETSTGLAQFLETTLPFGSMHQTIPNTRPAGSANQIIVFNQSWEGKQGATVIRNTFIWDPGNAAYNHFNAETPPMANVVATSGSGGDFLGNEIFYRVALMRSLATGTTPLTGHLNLPGIQAAGSDFNQANTQALVQNAKAIITDALSAF
ncbi:MAG: hypothetical protein ABI760_09225, partial [Ferruginibacter sp.]